MSRTALINFTSMAVKKKISTSIRPRDLASHLLFNIFDDKAPQITLWVVAPFMIVQRTAILPKKENSVGLNIVDSRIKDVETIKKVAPRPGWEPASFRVHELRGQA